MRDNWMTGAFDEDPVACPVWLAEGTRIATVHGDMPIEEVQPGMRVLTRAAGLVRVRAVGAATTRNRISPQAVLLPAGALGLGLPDRDLTVSGDQRVFVFGDPALHGDGFVAAAGLAMFRGALAGAIRRLDLAARGPVALLATGAWLESACQARGQAGPARTQAVSA